MGWEIRFLDWLQTLRTPVSDWAFKNLTHLGDAGIFWILLTLALIAYPRTRRAGWAALAAIVLQAIPVNLVLKPLAGRIRPFDVNTTIQLLIKAPKDFSFPSGHSAISFAVSSALVFFGMKKTGWWLMLLSAMIAFSRMYLYVHYPTDVLAGLLVGVLSAWIGVRLAARIEDRIKKKQRNAKKG